MKRLICSLALLILMGCGGAPIPHDKMSSAEAEIRAAQVVVEDLRAQGPNELAPKAQLHLKMAKDQVESAKKLIADGETEEAERVLGRAQVDASYALALAKEAAARGEANGVLNQVEELKKKAGAAR